MAQQLIELFEKMGWTISKPFQLSTFIKKPCLSNQEELRDKALSLSKAYLEQLKKNKIDLWITYHVYHKSPDWIGPIICKELGIPYIIFEPSYARKREKSSWQINLDSSKESILKASHLFTFSRNDTDGLLNLVKEDKVTQIKPFINASIKPPFGKTTAQDVTLITTAMMRAGDKFESYKLLAQSLKHTCQTNYKHIVYGHGECRKKIEKLFDYKTKFLGCRKRKDIFKALEKADIFVWPAVNEAYCLSLLEAHACGVPIIAGDFGGVSEIVDDQKTGYLLNFSSRHRFSKTFGMTLDKVIRNPFLRKRLSQQAYKKVLQNHQIDVVKDQIEKVISDLIR